MRIKVTETKVYKFDELSEEAQETILNHFAELDNDWYQFTYEDAANVYIKITAFDIDRGNYIEGEFLSGVLETAHKIEKEHGELCETYKTTMQYLKDRDEIIDTCPRDEDGDIDEYECDNRLDELDAEFKRAILEDYLSLLRKEYEYQTSKEAILETINANEYEFTEDGNIA